MLEEPIYRRIKEEYGFPVYIFDSDRFCENYRLLTGGMTRFLTLFRGSRSRSEVVATFLAVLELCKARRLRLAGAQEDCTVTCTQEGEVPLDLTADREPS